MKIDGWMAPAARLSHRAGLNGLSKRLVRLVTRDSIRVTAEGLTVEGPVASWRLLNHFRQGQFEPYERGLFADSISRGMTVLDIGANVGLYSLSASRAVGGDGIVYAFEPDPRTRRALVKNVSGNGADNVRVLPYGASAVSGSRVFMLSSTAGHSSLHPAMSDARPETIAIDVVAIDELELAPVDVIKMDVEGEEPSALQGLRQTLATSPDVQLFLEWNPRTLRAADHDPDAFAAELTRLFECVEVIDERAREIRPFAAPFGPKSLNLRCRQPRPTHPEGDARREAA